MPTIDTAKLHAEPQLEYICSYWATLTTPEVIGPVAEGLRLNVYVTDGEVLGPQLRGRLRPVGGDWLLIRRRVRRRVETLHSVGTGVSRPRTLEGQCGCQNGPETGMSYSQNTFIQFFAYSLARLRVIAPSHQRTIRWRTGSRS